MTTTATEHRIEWAEVPGRLTAECAAGDWTEAVEYDEASALRAFRDLEAGAADHLKDATRKHYCAVAVKATNGQTEKA